MSDEEGLAPSRVKNLVFTIEERKLLLLLVNKHYDIVNNKKVDTKSTQLKNQAWEAINKDYLEQTNLARLPRTTQQLKRCWENMKCRAKKGDPASVKLMRWGEAQYWLQKSGVNVDFELSKGSSLESIKDDPLDVSSLDDKSTHEEENNHCDDKSDSNEIMEDNNMLPKTEKFRMTNCTKCSCHRQESEAEVELINLTKQHKKELHNLRIQLEKDRIKREKELHKLAVHELTLRVENERRRAEILEKELGNS